MLEIEKKQKKVLKEALQNEVAPFLIGLRTDVKGTGKTIETLIEQVKSAGLENYGVQSDMLHTLEIIKDEVSKTKSDVDVKVAISTVVEKLENLIVENQKAATILNENIINELNKKWDIKLILE